MLINSDNLIYVIVDYLAFVKKVEFSIMLSNGLTNTNVFRAFTKKELSREGVVKFESSEFRYRFHGNGISLISDQIKTKYSYLPIAEFNISFHKNEIHNFAVTYLHYQNEDMPIDSFSTLCEKGIIAKLWNGFEIFYIPSLKIDH